MILYKAVVLEVTSKWIIVQSRNHGIVKLGRKPDVKVGMEIYYLDGDIYKSASVYTWKPLTAVAVMLIAVLLSLNPSNQLKLPGLDASKESNQVPSTEMIDSTEPIIIDYNPLEGSAVIHPVDENPVELSADAVNFEKIISVDINPSFELVLNNLNRVSAVRALNQDAKALIDDKVLLDKYYTLAVKDIISEAKTKGYLKSGTVLLSSNIDEDSESILDQLKLSVKPSDETSLYYVAYDNQSISEKPKDLSIGKYALAKDGNISLEKIKTMNTSQLIDAGLINAGNSVLIIGETEDLSNLTKNFESLFIVKGGTEYVPLQTLKTIGFDVNEEGQGVQIRLKDLSVLWEGEPKVIKEKGHTFVLLKEILEAFGISFSYDGTQLVLGGRLDKENSGTNSVKLEYGNPANRSVFKSFESKNNNFDNQDDMVVYQGVEFISEIFLVEQEFEISVVESGIKIVYKDLNAVVPTSQVSMIQDQRYYSLKDILDLFKLEYGYSEKEFMIKLDGEIINLKYKIINE